MAKDLTDALARWHENPRHRSGGPKQPIVSTTQQPEERRLSTDVFAITVYSLVFLTLLLQLLLITAMDWVG
jgi:hypothetical protein